MPPPTVNGHEHVVRDAPHGLEIDLALLRAGLDVVEDDLVDLVVVELLRELLGRRDVDVVLELLRLRDAPVDDVEAGDEPLGQHASDSVPGGEAAQQREAERSALLGVELRGDDVVARDHRAELDAVLGEPEHVGGVGRARSSRSSRSRSGRAGSARGDAGGRG